MLGAVPTCTTTTPSGVRALNRLVRKDSSVYRPSDTSVSSSGSRASRTMTSNLSFLAASSSRAKRSTNQCFPSAKMRSARGSSKQDPLSGAPSRVEQLDMKGRCSLAMSTSSSSISIMTASSTVLCLSTSRRVAPSPPPTMATRFGSGWANMAGWTSASWYSCSESESDCSVPSRKRSLSGLATSFVSHLGSPGSRPASTASW
mmetsp:Transcript_21637/g.63537  ORF Transcript_21637/g.63537 Transcript_21637/m.63537 type:complete len:203 (-) Transcript_21637:1287-1895(-)